MITGIGPQQSGIIKPPAGTPINYNHPLAKGLVGAVAFNEGAGLPYLRGLQTVAAASLPAVCSWEFGPSGPAMLFSGAATGFLNFGKPTALDLTTAGTIIVRCTGSFGVSPTGFAVLLAKENLNTDRSGYAMWVAAGTGTLGVPTLELCTASALTDYINSGLGPVVTNKWVTIATSFVSGSVPYILEEGRNGYTGSTAGITVVGSSGFNFCIGGSDTFTTNNWKGSIDYVYIWNRRLSIPEMQQVQATPFIIYQSPSSRFYSLPTTSNIAVTAAPITRILTVVPFSQPIPIKPKPNRGEFIGLNQMSPQFINLAYLFPLWGDSMSLELEVTGDGLIGTPLNTITANDPQFGQVYKGDGTARGITFPINSVNLGNNTVLPLAPIPPLYSSSPALKPQRGDYTGLNWQSPQMQNILALFPLWGDGTSAEIDLVGGMYPTLVWDTFSANEPYFGRVNFFNQTNTNSTYRYPPPAFQKNIATVGFSVSFWFRYGTAGVVATMAGNAVTNGWNITLSGNIQFKAFNSSVATSIVSPSVNDNVWHHAVCTYSGSSQFASIYLDGVLVSSGALVIPNPDGTSLTIGDSCIGCPLYMCDMRIYKGDIGASNVAAMYHPDLRWEIYQSSTKLRSRSYLENITTVQSIVAPQTPNGFTITFWVNTTSAGVVTICSNRTSVVKNSGFEVAITGGSVEFISGDGFSLDNTAIGTTKVNDGNWHQVAITFYNGITTFYVDGNLDFSQIISTLPGTSANNFLIGIESDKVSNPLSGLLSDLRIYSVALSQADINGIYSPDSRWDLYSRKKTMWLSSVFQDAYPAGYYWADLYMNTCLRM